MRLEFSLSKYLARSLLRTRQNKCINHGQVKKVGKVLEEEILGALECWPDSFIRSYLNDYHYAPNARTMQWLCLAVIEPSADKDVWNYLLIHLVAPSQHPTSNRKGVGRAPSIVVRHIAALARAMNGFL